MHLAIANPKKERKIGKKKIRSRLPSLSFFGLVCHSQPMSTSCQIHVHGYPVRTTRTNSWVLEVFFNVHGHGITSHLVYHFSLQQSDFILTQFVDFQLGAKFVLSDVDQVLNIIFGLIPGLGEPLLVLRQANACQPNMDVGLRRKTFPRLMSRK